MTRDGNRSGPALAGIRVVDMGRILAAPLAGQILADFGADVIKVERPGSGDEGRTYGPSCLVDANGKRTQEASLYLSGNRNKRSITLDLSKPEAREVAKRLISQADVLIENFLPGTMKRFGLDYEAMAALNPRLVYCSITGYGQTGPYANRPGYDPIFQAQSGMMQVTGHADEEPGGGPMRVGPSVVDTASAYSAAIAIMTALLERERLSGRGQYIDVALLDTAMAMQAHLIQDHLVSGKPWPRKGTAGNGGHPARVYHCRDGVFYLSVGNDKFYASLCTVLKRSDLIADPRFATGSQRYANRQVWDSIAEPLFMQWALHDLLEALDQAGVPAGAVNTYGEAFADPHVVHRGIRQTVPHPLGTNGELAIVANPSRLTRTPATYERRPPLLGEHTESVLQEWLGLEQESIERLRRANAV